VIDLNLLCNTETNILSIFILFTDPNPALNLFFLFFQVHSIAAVHVAEHIIFGSHKSCCIHLFYDGRALDLISELDMFGIVNAKVISKGRYGRTREIKIELSNEIINKIEKVFSTEFI